MRLSDLKPAWLIRREAINWLARRRGDSGADVEASFRRWYASSPRHAAAFDREENRFHQTYGLLRASPLAEDRQLVRPASEPPHTRFALAAALAAVFLIPAVVLLGTRTDLLAGSAEAMMLVSNVGEIRTFALADGSSVTLDAQSRVRLELGPKRRAAWVEQGRVRFRVKADARPFEVRSGALTVETAGGTLDVSLSETGATVEVQDGTARLVADAEPRVVLVEGQAAAEAPSGPPHLFQAPAGADWTRGMLQFDNVPLASVVHQANLYSNRQIRLADPALGNLKVTGSFRAGDPEGLAEGVARAFNLKVISGPERSLVLSPDRSAAGAAKKNGG